LIKTTDMRKLFAGGCFFEGARWHEGSWWVSDMYDGKVWRISPEGTAEIFAEVPQRPSGLGWLPNGDLLIVSIQSRELLRRGPDGNLTVHADLSACARYWINDMVVDPRGRAYIGDIGFDPLAGGGLGPTRLCRVDPDGRVSIAAEGLLFPNGTVLSRDGKTLIVGESLGNRMTAFALAEDGSLHDRRIWAQFGPTPSPADYSFATLHSLDLAPDGCAIDREDCIWVADAANQRICRVAEGGRIIAQISGPDNCGVYACALGGPDGQSLLICAAPDSTPDRCLADRGAVLYVATVAVPAW
jgi:sugar lactone lactonase YvrE